MALVGERVIKTDKLNVRVEIYDDSIVSLDTLNQQQNSFIFSINERRNSNIDKDVIAKGGGADERFYKNNG